MNKVISSLVTITAVSVIMIGCGQKAPPTSVQINEAIQAMAKAKTLGGNNGDTIKQQLNGALAAYRSGNYQDAVTQLLNIRAHTPMTGEQLIALNEALGAVVNDISDRANKGDEAAKAAMKEYERLGH